MQGAIQLEENKYGMVLQVTETCLIYLFLLTIRVLAPDTIRTSQKGLHT